FLFRSTPFAFEITAGKFSRSCRFLPVINHLGEIVLTFLTRGGRDRARHHHGFAALNYDRAVGQFRDLAGFNRDRIGAYLRHDLVLHFTFLDVRESRPVTLIVGVNSETRSALKPKTQGALSAWPCSFYFRPASTRKLRLLPQI